MIDDADVAKSTMLRLGPSSPPNRTSLGRALARICIVVALSASALTEPSLAQSSPAANPIVAAAVNSLHPGLVLLLGILLLALLLALPRTVFHVIGRGYRILTTPLGGLLTALTTPLTNFLRHLRLLPPEPKRPELPSIGAFTIGAIRRALTGIETEEAIALGVDRRELDGMLERNRLLLCHWLSPVPAPLDDYDAAAAEADRDKVKQFFSTPIPTYFNPFNPYDDADSAFIVRLFGTSDRRVFYVLSEFRKTITRNVLWLSILCSLVISVVALANIFLSTSIDFQRVLILKSELVTKEAFNKFIFGALSCSIGSAIMWLFYHTDYAQCQRNNGQQMNHFLLFYLHGISVHFNQISANAVNTVVQERDVTEMKHDTALWMTTLQWMAFRVFFIECYVRNVLFQIYRSSSYIVLLVPLAFIAAMLTIAYSFGIQQFDFFSPDAELYRQNSFYLFFLVLLFACYGYLRDCLSFIWLSVFSKTDPATGEDVGRWTKFHDLKVQDSITRTLDAYVDSLDRWRSMMKSRG